MPRLAALVLAAPALIAASSPPTDEALTFDDECANSADGQACALNAIQLRGVKKVEGAQEPDLPTSDEDLGAYPIWHYAQDCKAACPTEGFCEDFCGPGNACCNFYSRNARECQLASFFPIVLVNFWTCVTTTATAPSTSKAKECADTTASCKAWADMGECTKNPAYMEESCCSSCTALTSRAPPTTTIALNSGRPCTDNMNSCKVWAQRGECTTSRPFMTTNCCASCGGGAGGGGSDITAPALTTTPAPAPGPRPAPAGDPNCKDSSASCPSWSQAGECERNVQWMKANCMLSCKVCLPPLPDVPITTAQASTTAARAATTMTPKWETAGCKTATASDPTMKVCLDAVTWVYTDGLRDHPEWFQGLALNSPFEAVQYKISQDRPDQCPTPCAPSNEGCETPKSGECFKAVIFAKTDGIYGHPDWFPELTATSTLEEFQMHLHLQNATLCPKPCLKELGPR